VSHDRPPRSSERLQISCGETDSGVCAPTEGSKEDEGEVALFQMIDEKSQKREDRGAGVEIKVRIWDRRSVREVRVQRVRWWREEETRIWTRTSRGEQGVGKSRDGPTSSTSGPDKYEGSEQSDRYGPGESEQ
jgi:hypothetical protein